MKKLMTLMGVTAFALGAFADAYVANKVGFEENENYTTGSGVTAVTKDYATTIGAQLWYCADGDGDSKVEAYGDAAKYDYGSSDNLVGGPGSQYLSVSTSGNNPLYRALADTQGTALNPLSLVEELAGRDIVADTLVQFTASPTAQTPETGAKFALWLLGEDPAEVASPKTNLVVTAGKFVGSTLSSTNYNLTVEADVLPDQWHRVTVRAINGIAPKGVHVGFVVYIDGKIASCADDYYDDMLGSFDGKLTTEAFILKDRKQLFLSMVPSSENDAKTLAGVGFQGTGKVDDLSIVDGTEAPSFVAATTGFIITWSEGVESFKVGADTYTTANKDYVIVEPVNGAVAITDVVYANSYSKGTWTADGATYNDQTQTFTLTGVASGKIVAKTSVFEINGTPYQTFGAALAAAADAGGAVTIKAVADFDVTNGDLDENNPCYEISGDITLDLAGCTIKDARYDTASTPLFYVVEGGQMTVIDSAGSGCVVANDDGETGLFYGDYGATVTIGAATGDEGVTVDGTIGSATLVRGFFNDPNTKSYPIAEGSTCSEDQNEAGFYEVKPGSTPPEPTTYTVTFVDYDGTTIDADDVEEGVTPTAPADPTRTGYTFAGWEPTIEAVTSNTTYTATYSINTYTVTFDVDGDTTVIPAQNVDYGNTANEPTAPTKKDYTFAGWTLAGQPYDFAAQVTDDITLVATWTAVVPPTPSVDPIDPAKGGTAEFADVAAAAAAASAINDNKAAYITAPEGIAATYYSNVEAKADGTKVSVVFTADGEAAAQASADAKVAALDEVLTSAAVGATEATITGAQPGFFYSVVYGTALTGEGAFATEGDRAQADKDGNVTIPVPCAGEGAGFYKVKVSPTK